MRKAQQTKTKTKKLAKATSRRQSLKHQAYERVRFDIVTYNLPPGAKISEADLKRRYGLGYAPLRSALQRLVEQGLVTNRRRLGHVVAPITVRDIRAIFQLRGILEPFAVQLAVGSLDEKSLRGLRDCCRTTYSYLTQKSDKKVEFLFANREFCMIVARACGNELLCATIERLQDLMLRILYLGLHPKTSEEQGFQANNATLDAILSGDPGRAREIYQQSIEASERWILKSLLDLPKFQDLNMAQLGIGE